MPLDDAENLTSTPRHLTGGFHCTERTVQNLPKVKVTKGYASIIASGFDTVEESWDFTFNSQFIEILEDGKKEAADVGDKGAVSVAWGDELFHIKGHGGKGGTKYFLANEDFVLMIRGEKNWPLTVRYLSGGLWGEGLAALRGRVNSLVVAVLDDWQNRYQIKANVSRIDFAFDFHCEKLAEEMKWRIMEHIVVPAGVKRHPVGLKTIQTITLGSKSSLQVQLYDKGREIKEASGKTWMFDLWKQNGWPGPDDEGKAKGVWRLEFRFGKEYLRKRGKITLQEAWDGLPELIAEAVYSYRLTRPNRKDSNMRRWPLHPLWQMAADENNCQVMAPLGKRITLSRDALSKLLSSQIAGCIRTQSVVDTGDFKRDNYEDILKRVEGGMDKNLQDRKSIELKQEAYRFIDSMK